jgi:hypothetical protein
MLLYDLPCHWALCSFITDTNLFSHVDYNSGKSTEYSYKWAHLKPREAVIDIWGELHFRFAR